MFERELGQGQINVVKLDRELRQSLAFTRIYLGYVQHEGGTRLVFTEEPNEIALDQFLQAFNPNDVLQPELIARAARESKGAELWKQLTAEINVSSPVFTTIDSWLVAYQGLTFFRTLIQDGFFEFSLRYFVKTIVPMGVFSPDQVTKAKALIRVAAMQFGSTEAQLEAIETAQEI